MDLHLSTPLNTCSSTSVQAWSAIKCRGKRRSSHPYDRHFNHFFLKKCLGTLTVEWSTSAKVAQTCSLLPGNDVLFNELTMSQV